MNGLIYTTLLSITVILSGCDSVICDEDSEAVARARSLSAERLELLYDQMEELVEGIDQNEFLVEFDEHNGGIPEEFKDIQPVMVRAKRLSSAPTIRLKGCFDHHIDLYFVGIVKGKESQSPKQIILSWGEHDSAGDEVLWMERTSANQAELTTPDAARPTS